MPNSQMWHPSPNQSIQYNIWSSSPVNIGSIVCLQTLKLILMWDSLIPDQAIITDQILYNYNYKWTVGFYENSLYLHSWGMFLYVWNRTFNQVSLWFEGTNFFQCFFVIHFNVFFTSRSNITVMTLEKQASLSPLQERFFCWFYFCLN